MAHQILRLPDVKARTGLGRSTIYQRISEGLFPKAVNLGSRAVGWLSKDVETWLQRQITASRKREAEEKSQTTKRSRVKREKSAKLQPGKSRKPKAALVSR
jgi:prophage regulatory protein